MSPFGFSSSSRPTSSEQALEIEVKNAASRTLPGELMTAVQSLAADLGLEKDDSVELIIKVAKRHDFGPDDVVFVSLTDVGATNED